MNCYEINIGWKEIILILGILYLIVRIASFAALNQKEK